MKTNKTFQLLGFDPNWICVIYDLIIYNYDNTFKLEVFPNIKTNLKAADRLKKVPFNIKKMSDVQSTQPVFFGVVSGKNKNRIYNDFLPFLQDDQYENLIAKSSILSASNILKKGVFIDHQCILSAQTLVGFGVTIKRGSKIGHHNTIGDFTDINPGVITSGNVTIGRGCEIGSGSVVNNNVIIGDNSYIGMGSVVTKNIPANSIAYGSPCKVIRQNNLWKI